MPKVTIYVDERYPDYGLRAVDPGEEPYWGQVEVADDLVARYEAVQESYRAMQGELAALHDLREPKK